MISYSVSSHRLQTGGGKVEFSTDSDELYENVTRYIQTCADACSWRNRVERVNRFEEDVNAAVCESVAEEIEDHCDGNFVRTK